MNIEIGMSRVGLRSFANDILTACDEHSEGQGIEVCLTAQPNGSGPELTITLDNDDMEDRDDLSDDVAYWTLNA